MKLVCFNKVVMPIALHTLHRLHCTSSVYIINHTHSCVSCCISAHCVRCIQTLLFVLRLLGQTLHLIVASTCSQRTTLSEFQNSKILQFQNSISYFGRGNLHQWAFRNVRNVANA